MSRDTREPDSFGICNIRQAKVSALVQRSADGADVAAFVAAAPSEPVSCLGKSRSCLQVLTFAEDQQKGKF